MVKKLTNAAVKMGAILPVKNLKKKHPTEADDYVCVHVEDVTGKNEYALLLTRNEYIALPCAAIGIKLKPGRLYPLQLGWVDRFIATFIDTDGVECTVTIGVKALESFKARALKNPEDVPKKSMLTNLLD